MSPQRVCTACKLARCMVGKWVGLGKMMQKKKKKSKETESLKLALTNTQSSQNLKRQNPFLVFEISFIFKDFFWPAHCKNCFGNEKVKIINAFKNFHLYSAITFSFNEGFTFFTWTFCFLTTRMKLQKFILELKQIASFHDCFTAKGEYF